MSHRTTFFLPLPLWGRVGRGPVTVAGPHPNLPPEGEGAMHKSLS
jgi:hypothetical protein